MRVRLVALLVTCAIALTGGLVTPSLADPSHDLRGAPTVGRCYDLTSMQAAAASAHGSVPCSKPHTLWIVAVGTPSQALDLTSSSDALKASQQVCTPGIKRAVGDFGAQFAMSAYLEAYFVPTQRQQEAGAHWVSCELALQTAHGYETLNRNSPIKLGKTLPARYRLCALKDLTMVNCAVKHEYSAAHAFPVHQAFTQKRFDAATLKRCPRYVRGQNPVSANRIEFPHEFFVTCLRNKFQVPRSRES
jgi:hypothetical protein